MKRINILLLLLPGLLIAAFPTPASAQVPLLEVDYQNNPVFHVLSDGTVYMPISATAGYVLTTDGDGYGAWQPIPDNGSLSAVTSNATLTGDGTPGDPLGVSVPLILTGSDDGGLVQSTHSSGTFGHLSSSAWGVFGLYPNGNKGGLGSEDYGAFGVHDNGNAGYFGSSDYGAYGAHTNGHSGALGLVTAGAIGSHADGHVGILGGVLFGDGFGAAGIHANGNSGLLGGEDYGVYGEHTDGNFGYFGSSDYGAFGEHDNGHYGWLGGSNAGVFGMGTGGNFGRLGDNTSGVYGLHGTGNRGRLGGSFYGARGEHANGNYGYLGSHDYGVYGNGTPYAGYFDGDVRITGDLTGGSAAFKVDHPLDPENQYLSHSAVESPDMKNVYDGTVTTDAQGFATVTLPEYFEALNRDFRYQLTVIGQFAQAIVAEKIRGNRFVIRTDQPNVEVSWQVTGIRQDPWAEENRIVVEEAKAAEERGYYLHPALYGQPEERSVEWARDPEGMRAMREMPQRREEQRRQIEQERQRIQAERERMQRERAQRPLRPGSDHQP